MPFPNTDRILYTHNPLAEVICQLRFPRLLRIETSIPTSFQEAIYDHFPFLEEKSSNIYEVNIQDANVGKKSKPVYEFLTPDKLWKTAITSDFFALSTHSYKRWEEFAARLEGTLAAFTRIYQPKYFSRIGLRYQDLIRRSALNLANTPWSELIKPQIVGIFGTTDFPSNQIEDLQAKTLIRLNCKNVLRSSVLIQYGIVLDHNNEECFLIDCDFFTNENVEINNARSVVQEFNQKAGKLFRWCITEKLHHAMGPQPIE